jgi:putative DNA primase/helicase
MNNQPAALPVRPENVPEVLKALPRWVVWHYEEEVDEETGEVDWVKPPLRAGGGPASNTNPKTWATFPEALAAYERGGLDGIGFVLHRKEGETGGLVGIYLDHCYDAANGANAPWAWEIVKTLNTYTEVSPSGEGLRLFVFGDLPPAGRKKGDYENYQAGRYVTITGQRLDGTPPTIEHRQAELEAVHR